MEKKKKDSYGPMIFYYICVGVLSFLVITCLGFTGYAVYRTPIIAREQQLLLREWEAEKQAQAAETARIIAEKERASAQAKAARTSDSSEKTADENTSGTIRGLAADAVVYVSEDADLIHSKSNCSGMKYYRAISIRQADSSGYEYCEICW